MKTITKLSLCIAVALCVTAFKLQAAQTERLITYTLSGFRQGEDSLHNPKAIPFRVTTRDVLEEIMLATGEPVTNGVLVWIESLDDTNAPIQIVARKDATQLDVSALFTFDFGDAVVTDLGTRGTFYAIDGIEFSSLDVDTNGLSIQFQGLTKEAQAFVTKKLGTTLFNFTSVNTSSAGVGNVRFIDNLLLGPVKGTIKIGAPKLVETPVTTRIGAQLGSSSQQLPPLPPLP